jgi:hypothetical protein
VELSPRICGFAICGLTKKCACPPLLEAKTLYSIHPGIMPPAIPSLPYVYLVPFKKCAGGGGEGEGEGSFLPLPAGYEGGGLSLGSTRGRLNYTVVNRYSQGEYVSVPRLRIR